MPQTNSIAGLEYFVTNSNGHIMDCSFASTPFDTTTLTYGVGCQAVDRSTGDVYTNTGTSAAPTWTKQPKIGSHYSQAMKAAGTYSLFGTCPVGMSGTITGVRATGGSTSTNVLTFSKNGTTFATLTTSCTLGLTVACPLGSATAGGNVCPVGSVTFSPTDVMNVTNAGPAIIVEVTVDFV